MNLFDSLKYRLNRHRFRLQDLPSGISLRLHGRQRLITVPTPELMEQRHEFHRIFMDDCYELSRLRQIKTIVDCGANLGFFAIACERFHPGCSLYCFEPNAEIFPILQQNTNNPMIICDQSALGVGEGFVSIALNENSLHTVAFADSNGDIRMRALADVCEQIGCVDLVKLDCEGAEWEMLSDPKSWHNVRNLVMEYHLWARNGATVDCIRSLVEHCGFEVVKVIPSDLGGFGFLFGRKPE